MGVLGERGSSMVLHGHTHVAHRVTFSEGQNLHVFGCGSSTWTHEDHMARYAIYHIEAGELKGIETRVFSSELGAFRQVTHELESTKNPQWLTESVGASS